MATVLDALVADDWCEVRNDRRFDGGLKANVDHLVLGSFGLLVVDAKNWGGSSQVAASGVRAGG